jgi:trk system potassium uptake protein TrkA
VVIDNDARSFRRLGGTFNGITLEGVAFDEEVLSQAEIERADAFAAVTNFDNTNFMAAEVAKSVYGVPRVIARLYNPDKELTFFKMGIDYVSGTPLIAESIREKLLQRGEVIVQDENTDLGIQVVEFSVPPGAEGTPAGSLEYGVSSRVIALLRNNRETPWNEETALQPGDRIVTTLRKEGWQTVRKALGERLTAGAAKPGAEKPVVTAWPPSAAEEKPIKAIIGGCGRVGSQLAYILSMDNHDVTIVDRDLDSFKRLPAPYSGRVVEGTAFDEEALTKAGIEEADAFAAVTNFDNTNLMAAEVARHVFDVPQVVARLYNPDKEPTYQALGINYLCGTKLVAQVMMERMFEPEVRFRAYCCNNVLNIVEFECAADWEGKNLKSLKDKLGVKFAFIARRSTGYLPDNNFRLKKGDSITALASERGMYRLERYLRSH